MPVVLAHDADDPSTPILLAFPRRSDSPDSGGWEWDEVAVRPSAIEGNGLYTLKSDALRWSQPELPLVALPFLGRETEVGSREEAQVCAKVLKGDFVALPARELCVPPPGQIWVTGGLFVELADEATVDAPFASAGTSEQAAAEAPAPAAEASAAAAPAVSPTRSTRRLRPEEEVLQIEMQTVVTPGEAASCFYMLSSAAAQLLHIPPHIFSLLKTHRKAHHTDRHFVSHVVSYRKAHGSHLLVNAHPCFADGAYALGTVNEPLDGEPPSLEMRLRRIVLRPHREQKKLRGHAQALAHWEVFAAEFPEVLERHIFFMTCNDRYSHGEELTASYGAEYHRAYGCAFFDRPPPTAIVPFDTFGVEALRSTRWPTRQVGWWNTDPELQPRRRKAFCLDAATGAVAVVPDKARYVLARKLIPQAKHLQDRYALPSIVKRPAGRLKGSKNKPKAPSAFALAAAASRAASLGAVDSSDEEGASRPSQGSSSTATTTASALCLGLASPNTPEKLELPPGPPAPLPPPRLAPAPDASPLTYGNALFRRVLVPHTVWPDYACDEVHTIGTGAEAVAVRGWEASVDDVNLIGPRTFTVVVSFVRATDEEGACYEPEELSANAVIPF